MFGKRGYVHIPDQNRTEWLNYEQFRRGDAPMTYECFIDGDWHSCRRATDEEKQRIGIDVLMVIVSQKG